MPLDPSFALMLRPFDRATLDASSATICAVDTDFRIGYVNPAWARFARANGASWGDDEWTLGANMLDAVPRPLRSYYKRLFHDALDTRVPHEHTYECSSPDVFRRFRMRVLPCERASLVLEHSLIVEVPHDTAAEGAVLARYQTEADLFIQCGHCRRVRRSELGRVHWDWVRELVAEPRINTSHSLCAICREFYFPA